MKHFGVRNGETRIGDGSGVWRRCYRVPFIVRGGGEAAGRGRSLESSGGGS
jgi:hypothetical protein